MDTSQPPQPDHDAEQPASRPRQPLTQRTYHSVIDRQIAAGQAERLFDDLPGAGKPLPLDDDALVPEEVRVGYRMLKGAGFAPPWIELQKNIRAEHTKLQTWLERANGRWVHSNAVEQQRLRNEYRERIAELNRLILHYNLVVPPAAGQLPALRLEDELPRLGAVPPSGA